MGFNHLLPTTLMSFRMDTKLILVTLAFFLLLVSLARAQTVFDITKYGGAANADITTALTNAFKEACASPTASKVVIPAGTYKLNAVDLKGPCKAPLTVQVDGTVQAPPDPSQMNGADQWVKFGYITSFTLTGSGTFDGQGATAWKQNNCGQNSKCKMASMNFGFNFLTNAIISQITSKDSKNFNVNVLGCKNITFDHFTISAPKESLNTDGIHVGRSTLVNIIDTKIATGDDCVSLGDGSKQVTVEKVTCGPGHGFSVGSLGKYEKEEPVEGFTVRNCTLEGTDNGVRIKSWPGTPGVTSVTDMHFEDIIMKNVKNPIIIDQEYCPWNQCTKQTPSKVKISKVTFKNIRGTSATAEGVTLACSSGVPCEGVELGDIDLTFNGAPTTAKCSNVKPTITGKAPTCAAA